VRPGAPFCSLCHADFRPRPAVVEAPVHPYATAAAVDPLTAPLLDVVLPAAQPPPATEVAAIPQQHAPAVPAPRAEPMWPCHACGASNPLSNSVCAGCGGGFLAAASEQLSVVLPGVGDVMRMSRGQRALLAIGAAALLVVVPVLLLGALF